MAKLIILRGNSGSGKTVAAKALQRKFGHHTLVISQDAVRREMLWVKDGIGNRAEPLLMHLLEYGRTHCEVTILEGILYSDCYEALFQKAVELYGDEIFAYYYDLPFEETLARHQTKPNCEDFGEESMRKWWREKDYLSIIKEKTISQDMSLKAAVKMIGEDVLSKNIFA